MNVCSNFLRILQTLDGLLNFRQPVVYYLLFIRIGYVFAGHNTHSFQDILKTNFQFWFDMKVVQNFNEIFAPVATVELQIHNLLTKKICFNKI